MAIKIFYVDLRNGISQYMRFNVAWYPGMEAVDALNAALKPDLTYRIVDDLAQDNPQIIISWHNDQLGEQSEIDGVASLDWQIEDESTLAVIYEDDDTTERQIDESSGWMLENDE